MNKDKFRPRRTIENQYRQAIGRILRKLRGRLVGVTNLEQIQTILQQCARSPTFEQAAREAAKAMATSLFSDGHKTWREAAAAGSKGAMIHKLLKREMQGNTAYWDIIDRNAELIKSIPARYTVEVSNKMAEAYQAGVRPESMVPDLLARFTNLSHAHAKLIARTECAKAATALTRVRALSIGCDWYVWRTSDDARVRESHKKMDGVLVNWNDPPSPEALIGKKSPGNYHAGDIYNCRCYAQPLLEYSDVTWPHKVYHAGSIQMMTLAKFKAMTGGEAA